MRCESSGLAPLLAIVGPTATGKTEVSVEVARRLGAEIVSADSMLIYRRMNIGTAKPTLEERGGVPHHMIDVVDPGESYNVSLYSNAVQGIIQGILQKGRLPVLTGGTGLYVKAVIDGYNFSEAGQDQEFRSRLLSECETLGKEALHQKLKSVDPAAAERLHVNDVKRVVRALEVYHLSGRTLSDSAGKENVSPFNLLMYGLTMDRNILYYRIEKRVDRMLEEGLIEEVESLLAAGYTGDLTSMQGLGYKEIILYLNGELSRIEAVDLLKMNTRRFAKRQLTWFRRDGRIQWIDAGVKSPAEVAAEIAASAEGVFVLASNDF